MDFDIRKNKGIKVLGTIGLLLMAQTTVASPSEGVYAQNVSWARQGWNQKTRDFYISLPKERISPRPIGLWHWNYPNQRC